MLAHFQLKLDGGEPQDASVDHLSTTYIPSSPILYQAYVLIMSRVEHIWQCENSCVCLLAYWHKEP